MKKLLIGTAAIALGVAASAPAKAADGVKLGLGGFFAGYVTWLDQDDETGVNTRSFDIQRETEVHLNGETTLDNGLTVGAHFEMEADGYNNTDLGGGTDAADSFNIEESYAYFSGAWGRVNFGAEDGAAFLLQVAAPSADSNIDGLRQQIQPVNYANTALGDNNTYGPVGLAAGAFRFDYDNNPARFDNKLTYMTPVFSGFQAGVSYTTDTGCSGSNALAGNCTKDEALDYGSVWELAARYEGKVANVGVTAGAGYTKSNLEVDNAFEDDDKTWDAGLNLKWSAFDLGGAYLKSNNGANNTPYGDGDTRVWVAGLDYTIGAYKLGMSYYNQKQDVGAIDAVLEDAFYAPGDLDADVNGVDRAVDTDRWSAGVQYTYGPGMTFRGSVNYINHQIGVRDFINDALDEAAVDDSHTFVMLGTQINF